MVLIVPTNNWCKELSKQNADVLGNTVFTPVSYLKSKIKVAPIISNGTRRSLMRRILKTSNLKYFKTVSSGVVSSFDDAIKRLKTNQILPDELERILSTRGGLKENDLLSVYRSYEKELSDRKWHDEQSLYNLKFQPDSDITLLGFIEKPHLPFDAKFIEPKEEYIEPGVYGLASPYEEADFIASWLAKSKNATIYLNEKDALSWEILRACNIHEEPFNLTTAGIVTKIFNTDLPNQASVLNFIQKILELLDAEYKKIEPKKETQLFARTISYFDSVSKALSRIKFYNEEFTEEINRDEFLFMLEQELTATNKLPDTLPFTFASWDDVGLYKNSLTIIPQFNSGAMPGNINNSVFFNEPDILSPLPDDRIKEIFPLASENINKAIKYLKLACTLGSIITYHLYDEAGNETSPSPLIVRWPKKIIPSSKTTKVSEIKPTCGTNFSSPSVLANLQTFLEGKHFSATRLEEYGNCPFTYFCRHILGLEPPDDVTPEVQAHDRGTLIHETLEIFFKENPKISAISATEIREKVSKIAEETFLTRNDITKKYHKEMVDHFKKRTKTLVTAVAISEQEFLKNSKMEPTAFELGFDDLLRGDIRLKGKIDRVDTDETCLSILDYKTGEISSVINGIKEGLELQIPIYSEMARRILKKEPAGAFLYSIKEQTRKTGIARKELAEHVFGNKKSRLSVSEDEWFELMEFGIKKACDYAEAIRNGKFEKTPHECKSYCDWKDVCRFRNI